VAPPSNRESYELADFNAVGRPPEARPAGLATARAQRFGSVVRLFAPATSSRSLAGLGSGINGEADWEKTASSEQRPRAFRSTRLRFWTEALRRRAHRAKEAQGDGDLETTAKMKFSHSIQFNAVPDWSSNYIAYSNLKKL
jgi:phosphate transporter